MARVGLMISEEPSANLNLFEGGLLLLAFPVLFCDDSHCVKTLDPCLCNPCLAFIDGSSRPPPNSSVCSMYFVMVREMLIIEILD